MTALDILVLLLIGGGAVMGFLRGFVMETLSLIAWVLGVFAISLFQGPVADLLSRWIGGWGGAAVLSMVLVFGVTFGIGKLIARALGQRTRQSVLGPVDRMLGLGFGGVKGLILATLAYLAFTLVYDTLFTADADRPTWLASSRTYPLLSASGAAISDFVAERRRRHDAATAGDDNTAAPTE